MIQNIPNIVDKYSLFLGSLPYYDYSAELNVRMNEISVLFNNNQSLPGVVLTDGGQFAGIVTRDQFFEALGRPFGVELFLKFSLLEFYQQFGSPSLVLEANTRIDDAVRMALSRNDRERYAPVVVNYTSSRFRLIDMVTILSAQCGVLEKLYGEVQKISLIDPLTNVNNRRGFFEIVEHEVETACKYDLDMAILMIDIDNFKLVNDIYGHFIGDYVIRSIAEESQKAIRQTDLFGRLGGEEFVVFLPSTSLETANVIAERLRARIENLIIYVEGFQVSVTVSVGVSFTRGTQDSLDKLLTRADQAMYSAKYAGRNQVVIWNPTLDQKVNTGVFTVPNEQINHMHTGSRQKTDLSRIYDETIEGWAHAIELRDKETEGHAQRVTEMTIKLAKKLGYNEADLVDIRRGALLHDIGKIAIPDSILFKPGKLTEEEWVTMRKHPSYAFELLSPITYLQKAVQIPYRHHEHWDGSGYPGNLKGEEIPREARIFTIVDVWDALSSDRCYRPAWPAEKVKEYLIDEAGKMFDPYLVLAFLELLEIQPARENGGQELTIYQVEKLEA